MSASASAPRVRLLLDTGPTEQELRTLEALFREVGMTVTAEGHSYGGPPPTSAFLIVVNTALVPFLDSFTPETFESLARRLLAMRANTELWGRPHGLKLEDAHSQLSVGVEHDLPPEAFAALLDVELSGFDRGSPPVEVLWSKEFRRWQACVSALSRRVFRGLPARDRESSAPPQVRDDDIRELWRLAGCAEGSVVTWQRAQIVLWAALGWSDPEISRKTLVSAQRVRAVVQNFAADGFASLRVGYTGGRQPEIAHADEVAQIAARPGWTLDTLADFLIGTGVVEDFSPLWSQLAHVNGL